MSGELKSRASRASRASGRRAKQMARGLEGKIRQRTVPLTAEDEAELALQYAAARGRDASRKERSKRRHELGTGAPHVSWTPPQLRHTE